MRKETSEWSIRMLVDFQNRIDVNREYQRGKVWSAPQQALLIDSILRGFDIPKIYVRKNPPDRKFLFDLIDGKQRLTAIWRYMSDELRLPRMADEFPGLGDLSGKRWKDLPLRAQDQLQFANVTVSKIEEANAEEVRELFLRLQKGEPLNSAEKRNAMAGPVRDFVALTMAKHALWTRTGLSDKRYGLHTHAAILLALVRKGGAASLKGADLEALYQDDGFDSEGTEAEKTISLLNILSDVASYGEGVIRTRWGLVDLAISLMRLGEDQFSAARIMDFYRSFETLRRDTAATLSDLQTELVEKSLDDATKDESIEVPNIDADLLAYHLAFTREGATEENVKTRSDIMHGRLLEYLDGALK